jgi:hypothetical protein
MYCAPVLAFDFAAHVRACVAPAACEDAAHPERKPDSDTPWITLDSLIENNSQLYKQTMASLRHILIENDSQIAAFDFQCGYLVTPALTPPGGTFAQKMGFLGLSPESKKAIVENLTPRTNYPTGENR